MNYREALSKHRSAIMGLMALLIILYHADWSTGFRIYDNTVNQFGSIGVDVFVFVSGFGLSYALAKSERYEMYFSRRLARILPAYYIFEFANLLLALCFMAFGIKSNLYQSIESWIIPVGVWFNYDSHKWFIAGILGFYVIALLLYPVMQKSKYLYLTACFMLLISVGFIPFIANMDNMPLAVERIPALVIGLVVGTAAVRKEQKYHHPVLGLIFLAALCFVGVSMYFLCGRLPGEYLSKITDESNIYVRQSLIAPFLAVALAFIFELFEWIHLGFLEKSMAWLGKLSLELYLIHTLISGILEITPLYKSIQVLLTVGLSIPSAMLLKWLSDRVLMLWKKASKHFVIDY
jgi:peptidoglycan/LPS O-acetylase OafA/YrhL